MSIVTLILITRDFLSPGRSWGPSSLFYGWYRGCTPRAKRPRSPTHIAEAKMECRCTSTPGLCVFWHVMNELSPENIFNGWIANFKISLYRMYTYSTFVICLLTIFHILSCSRPLFEVKILKTRNHLSRRGMLLNYTTSNVYHIRI